MKTQTTTVFRIGTSGWNYDHWRGLFYPKDCPKSHWLDYYVQQFSSVEVNATFYRSFKPQTYEKWYQQTPANFRFVLKAPRLITHYKKLNQVDDQIQQFCENVSPLKQKLALILLQLAPNTPYDLQRLTQALLAFDNPKKVVVEFRDNQWLNQQTYQCLKRIGAVFCCIDAPEFEPMNWVTSTTAYLRCHGRSSWYEHDYNARELTRIKKRIDELIRDGAKTIYIFFNNDAEAKAPLNALALTKRLSQ